MAKQLLKKVVPTACQSGACQRPTPNQTAVLWWFIVAGQLCRRGMEPVAGTLTLSGGLFSVTATKP